jgi:hypothetical protein
MTEPNDPDWGFPEVDPASTELPADDDVLEALDALSARATEEGPFDTGSDAWWRAQAAAQRAAASQDPAPEPAGAGPDPTRKPLEQQDTSPLDTAWVPEGLLDVPSGPPLEATRSSTPEEPTPAPVPEPPAPPVPEPLPPAPAPVPPAPAPVPPAPAPLPPVPMPPPTPPPSPVPPVPPEPTPPPVPPEPTPPPVPPEPLPPVPPTPEPPVPPDAIPPIPVTRSIPDPRPVTPPAPRAVPTPPPPAVAPPAPADQPTAAIPPYPPDQGFYDALRAPAQPPPVGSARKLWGSLLAVAAVLLGIGAFWLLHDDTSTGGPTVALPSQLPSATQAPSPTHTATSRPTPTATTPVVRATTAPPVAAPIRPVLVLNNSRIKGLADRSAAKFRAGGWPVSGTGNYRGGVIAQTTIYYAPGQLASAQRFAKQFAIPRVLPRFSGLPGSGLTVVLTRDYR